MHCCEALSSVQYGAEHQPTKWPQGNKEVMREESRIRTDTEEDFVSWANAARLEVAGWLEESQHGEKHWLRPAFDGLTVTIDHSGSRDGYYH